jgi:hypothetical protein
MQKLSCTLITYREIVFLLNPAIDLLEDHVSMGGWAARKALLVVQHVEQACFDTGLIGLLTDFLVGLWKETSGGLNSGSFWDAAYSVTVLNLTSY